VKRDNEPYPFRRHLEACRFFGPGGRAARVDQCKCPFHVDGMYHGERVRRQSLGTRSLQIAERNLSELLKKLDAERAERDHLAGAAPAAMTMTRTLADAIDRFLATKGVIDSNGAYRGDVERGTYRKYCNSLRTLSSFCQQAGVVELAAADVDVLEAFRRTRKIGSVTWKVERQTLVTFFSYCVRRKWIAFNPAKELPQVRGLKPNEIVPYTLAQEGQILGACDLIGGGKYNRSGAGYEQLRARAMILLLRSTALRISDVATFPKDAVSWDEANQTWRIRVRTQKSGEPVYLPIPDFVKLALDAVPLPRNAARDCPYYFWNGITSRRAVVGIAERTLASVFKKSGVKNAHAHRFRHTLATRLLADGATFEQVADILGNSPAVVRKHYGKWAKGRQENIDRLMMAHFQTTPTTFPVTKKSHENSGAAN
jgi:site-specific recombinase XerD